MMGFFLASTLAMLRFSASMMSITCPCFNAAAFAITISLPLPLFIDHGEHTEAVLVLVTLGVELFRCEALDETDPELQLLFRDLHVLAFWHLIEIPHLIEVIHRVKHQAFAIGADQ